MMTVVIENLSELRRYQLRQGLAALDAMDERKRRQKQLPTFDASGCLHISPLSGVRCNRPRTHGSRCEDHF